MRKGLYAVLTLSVMTLGLILIIPPQPAAAGSGCQTGAECSGITNNGIEVPATCYTSGGTCNCPLVAGQNGINYINEPCPE
jgi:hypothetical protein